jgi:glutamyl-tRNA synthetase
MDIRVRYAPSPTGLQHIGGIRTALFNWLFARSAGGKFILRLEDTDRTRCDPAYEKNLYDTFSWLALRWDEGPDVGGPYAPYVQSERTEMYRRYAEELLEKGRAYRCFCSTERLEKVRAEREAAKSPETGYDRYCRNLSAEESSRRANAGDTFTVRLKIPLEQGADAVVTRFTDRLLGDIEWKNNDINPDPVLLKSDGFPTYHLANVVDDHLMEITHVLRAQEWLSSTPIHVILYDAFGWAPPVFCHLPMVMGEDGKKLSKRHGATSIDEFRRLGYPAEALINYTALLGCSYEEGKDLYTVEELGKLFSLEKLYKAPAVFDYKKLEWYNGQYIRMKSNEELAALSLPWALSQNLFGGEVPALVGAVKAEAAEPVQPTAEQGARFTAAMELVRERANFFPEIPAKLGYLFSEPALPQAEEFIPKKSDLASACTLLRMGRELIPLFFPGGKPAGDEEAERIVKEKAEQENVKLGDLLMPLRVALTGSRVSPPLFASIRLLGEERSLARIDAALAALSGGSRGRVVFWNCPWTLGQTAGAVIWGLPQCALLGLKKHSPLLATSAADYIRASPCLLWNLKKKETQRQNSLGPLQKPAPFLRRKQNGLWIPAISRLCWAAIIPSP